MKKIILYPTHRKFIRLLKDTDKIGKPIVIKEKDLESIHKLWASTQNSLERHKGIYKIVVRAMNENVYEQGDTILDCQRIDLIESDFCQAERKNLLRTIRNIIFTYIYRKTIHFVRPHTKNTTI